MSSPTAPLMSAGDQAAWVDERAEFLPHGTVEVWPGTTHSLPMQIPQELGPRLEAFWKSAG